MKQLQQPNGIGKKVQKCDWVIQDGRFLTSCDVIINLISFFKICYDVGL